MLFRDSQKVPWGVLARVPGKLGVPQGVLLTMLFLVKEIVGRPLSGALPGALPISRGTFWESPKSTPKALAGALRGFPKTHSESTRRSTFGDSPQSTPVNGGRDLKGSGKKKKNAAATAENPAIS